MNLNCITTRLHSPIFWVSLLLFFFFPITSIIAQESEVIGRVLSKHNGIPSPVPNANVYYLNQTNGTTTDLDGFFSIPFVNNQPLIISYVGYKSDTIFPPFSNKLGDLLISSSAELNEVRIEAKTEALKLNTISAATVQTITKKELAKAPCCNLSESFETNAGIDASFSDASTGQRQIQMLGLNGIYAQIMQENMPTMRSGYAMQGLSFIPGPWIQSIQISKGAGSVVNGFESTTGQINYELYKPTSEDLLFLNAYVNSGSRAEFNGVINLDISEKISTGILVHGNNVSAKNDNNNDWYLDMPTGQQINLMNRWKLQLNSWEAQAGVHYVNDERIGGYKNYDFSKSYIQNRDNAPFQIPTYEPVDVIASKNNKEFVRGFAKAGWVNPDKSWQSIGFQGSYTYYKDSLRYSFGSYQNVEHNYYLNSIYNSQFGNTNFPFKTGISVSGDIVDQTLVRDTIELNEYENTTVGAFFEQTILPTDKWVLSFGVRADYVSMHDTVILTPRVHMRHSPNDELTFRFNVGMGYRQPRPYANSLGLLMSEQGLRFLNTNSLSKLPLEQSVNTGLGFIWKREIDFRPFSFTADYFYTTFLQRVVYSREILNGIGYPLTAQTAQYQYDNPSTTTGILLEANYEIIKRLDLRVAYRFTQTRENQYYGFDEFSEEFSYYQPFHKWLFNVAYATRKSVTEAHWVFDATIQLIGKQRMPQGLGEFQINTGSRSLINYPITIETTPSFALVNLQITKHFNKQLNVYIGSENVLDVRQDPIITTAYGVTDATNIFAPAFGRMFYLGVKYNVAKAKK